MAHGFFTADVFTDRAFGGNPLAVFPDATGLDSASMQSIARELNLSETVFVLPPDGPDAVRRLRIFTPGEEIPFAGHPTVGTAFVLASIGEISLGGDLTEIVFEEGVGPVPVRILAQDGVPTFCRLTAARAPEEVGVAPRADELAAMLELEPGDVLDGPDGPAFFSCGIGFLFVRLADVARLGRARLDRPIWERLLTDSPSRNVFVFAPAESDGVDWQARMFAPAYGIEEDPATGSAVAAFAGWLARHPDQAAGSASWRVAQGVEMGRPSLLQLEAEIRSGRALSCHVGGASVMVSEGHFRVP